MSHISNMEEVKLWRFHSQNRLFLLLFCFILLFTLLFNCQKHLYPMISPLRSHSKSIKDKLDLELFGFRQSLWLQCKMGSLFELFCI